MYDTSLTPEVLEWLEKVRVSVVNGKLVEAERCMIQARTLIDRSLEACASERFVDPYSLPEI